MVELTDFEIDQEAGNIWRDIAAGVLVGVAPVGLDVLFPEASPVVTKIGLSVARGFMVAGIIAPEVAVSR
ncbi:MAG: hypothetical protein ACYCYO_11265 [Bacilli bacterium]